MGHNGIENSEVRNVLDALFSGLQDDSVQGRRKRVTRAADYICRPCDHLSEYALENAPCDRVSVEDLKAMEEPGDVSRQLLRLEYVIEFVENPRREDTGGNELLDFFLISTLSSMFNFPTWSIVSLSRLKRVDFAAPIHIPVGQFSRSALNSI